MVICGSYKFKFSVSKDMKKIIIREVAVGKVATRLCLTLIIKELKMSVDNKRVVTTLNIIKHYTFSLFQAPSHCKSAEFVSEMKRILPRRWR